MFKLVFVGALALATVPALAQDTTNAFNGPFIGLQAGWQQDRIGISVGTDSGSLKNDGFAYGGQVGYDARVSQNVVIGGEVSLTDVSGSSEVEDVELGVGRTINATARLGYVFGDKSLLYARGGYSNARFTSDDGVDSDGGSRGGFTIGAGYELMFARNVSARVEYNYADYGSEDFSDFVDARASASLSRHAVTAGVNFRF